MGFVEPANKKQEQTLPADWPMAIQGADSSIILKFIALHVKARGDGPFAL